MTEHSPQMKIGQLLRWTGAMQLLDRAALKDPLAKVWRFVRQPRSLVHEMELQADYRNFRWQCGSFLYKGQELADPNRKLLVLSFSDYVAQVKAEAFLAKGLQLHGITPVIVTHSQAQRALRYYRLFGIDQFVFFDEYLLESKISRHAVKEAEAFLAQPLTVQDIKNYQYHGTRLGAHLLRTLTRTTYKGSIDLSNPDGRRALKSMMLQGMHNVERAEVLLDRLQPEVIFTLHPLNLGEGDIYEVGLQRGINTIQWDSAQKDDHWIFKRYTKEARDRSFFSLSDETWKQARQMTWDEEHESALMNDLRGRYNSDLGFDNRRLQEGKKLKTKEEVQQQLGLDPCKKTAVVFSHIVWDSSFLQGVDLFDTYEEWLVETVRAACENSSVNWIIKLHPANLYKLGGNKVFGDPSEVVVIRNRIGDLPEHVKLLHSNTDINTWSLFELTDYCLTVRGTIGIEMPCFGIPVFTAGTGRYSGRGFTIDSDSREEYLNKLRRIRDFPPLSPQQTELAKKHAYWLFTNQVVKFDIAHKVVCKNRIRHLGHPLTSNYFFHMTSLDDLVSDRNLDRFCRWVLHSEQLDFCEEHSEMLERSL